MKYSFLILTLCLACNTSKPTVKPSNIIDENKIEKVDNNSQIPKVNRSVSYTYRTMRSFTYISIVDKTLYYSTDVNLNNIESYKCTIDDLKEIYSLLKRIDESAIHKLKAPSNAHTFDGAPMANLSIRNYDMVFKSTTFDHGNPPKELQQIIQKMLEITKKTVKA